MANLDDPKRLMAAAFAKLDHLPGSDRFDRITRLVAQTLQAPVSLISIVDASGQFFKSSYGLSEPWASARQTPLSHSFCRHVVESEKTLRVCDARQDPLVRDNMAVTDLNCIAYLGVPIRAQAGEVVGSLCAIDTQPRAWTDQDEANLKDFVGLVEDQLASANLQTGLRDILNTMPQMVWSTRPDGYHDFYNDRWYEFTGVPYGSTDGEGWNEMFHADDRERAWQTWRHSLATGAPYEIEYRLRDRNGQYRWTLGRALPIRNSQGAIERWFGTCTDIHDLKEAEEARDLISRELSHRIQNIFAVVTGLIAMAARSKPEADAFAKDLMTRLQSLAIANRYIKTDHAASMFVQSGEHQTYAGLIQTILAPYYLSGRIIVSGADSDINSAVATPLALILHELATNAVKYGALSNCEGRLAVEVTSRSDATEIEWIERGGPVIDAEPSTVGFGSQLVTSMAKAMRADVRRNWSPGGLRVHLRIPV
ncbi:PAS domain-containing protein [Hyphomicrobium sp.]|uniref:sensor histidine kinase n=1 Tax=Hyphomicrobium sp. TaxID=82 RepID=UPI000FA432C5|nr:PAS domain-containing protein [Hyphomicrobium sp.]RUO98953.1 MAG: GAF domain-containing protein [Hyphomicrobium sp.]